MNGSSRKRCLAQEAVGVKGVWCERCGGMVGWCKGRTVLKILLLTVVWCKSCLA